MKALGVLARVREALPQTHLTRVLFRRMAVDRIGDFDPGQPKTEVSIGSRFALVGAEAVYGFRLEASRADLHVEIEVELAYRSDHLDRWSDDEFQGAFGQRVALFAAYPFLRAKLHDLAGAVEAPPPILDILLGTEPDDRGAVGDDAAPDPEAR